MALLRRSTRIKTKSLDVAELENKFETVEERLNYLSIIDSNFNDNGSIIFNNYNGMNLDLSYLGQIMKVDGIESEIVIQWIMERYNNVKCITQLCDQNITIIDTTLTEDNNVIDKRNIIQEILNEMNIYVIESKIINVLRYYIDQFKNELQDTLSDLELSFYNPLVNSDNNINEYLTYISNNHSARSDTISTILNQLNIQKLSQIAAIKLSEIAGCDFVTKSYGGNNLTQQGLLKRTGNVINCMRNIFSEFLDTTNLNDDNDIEMLSNNDIIIIRRTGKVNDLKVSDLKKILRLNGKSTKGKKTELQNRIINDKTIDINVLNISITPPRNNNNSNTNSNNTNNNRNNNRNINRNNNRNINRNNNRNINRNNNAGNDTNNTRINNAGNNKVSQEERKLREECRMKIKSAVQAIESIVQRDLNDDIKNELEIVHTDLQRIQLLYSKVPRRFRNQYPAEFIEDRTKRQKKFNNIAPKLLNETAKLAIQCRCISGCFYASTDTVGIDKRAQTMVWISPDCQIVDYRSCTNIANAVKTITDKYGKNRVNIRANREAKEKDLIIKILLKTALEDGDVVEKAKHLNLGNILQELVNANYDLQDLVNEIEEEEQEMEDNNDKEEMNDNDNNNE